MLMNTGHAITLMVDAILPEHTKDKVLHILVDVYYLCFPHAEQDGNNVSDEIVEKAFVHYIFYRPTRRTIVLRKESQQRPTIFLEQQNRKIFHMTSCDCGWRQVGVEFDLFEIHWRIIERMKKKYKKITGRDMPRAEILDQPNSCTLSKIELVDGKASGEGRENRKYRLKVKDGKMNFIQIKEK